MRKVSSVFWSILNVWHRPRSWNILKVVAVSTRESRMERLAENTSRPQVSISILSWTIWHWDNWTEWRIGDSPVLLVSWSSPGRCCWSWCRASPRRRWWTSWTPGSLTPHWSLLGIITSFLFDWNHWEWVVLFLTRTNFSKRAVLLVLAFSAY